MRTHPSPRRFDARRSGVALLAAATLASALVIAEGADAVQGCRARVKKGGVIQVSAKDVVGTPRWGRAADQVTLGFANAADCVAGDKLSGCELGAPGTPEQVIPPELCTIFVRDDGAESCSAFLKGCTPGIRPGGVDGFVKKSGDTMTGALNAAALRTGFVAGVPCGAGDVCAAGELAAQGIIETRASVFADDNVEAGQDLEANRDLVVGEDLRVGLASRGFVKAVLRVNCSNNAGQVAITQSLNTVNSGAFSIDDGVLPGRCEVTFPFSLANRIIHTTTNGNAFVFFSVSGSVLELTRTEMIVPGLPTGNDGAVVVVVY